ncbi:Hsp33 family molecular chaperone HslO [Vulgatibacter sp.]|uniref:Hsp33 family molecular chaperone HslO n=1 Tax=Vulgatibacter sp. TaxID=1971226 RepID=UPI003561D1A3
MSRDHLLRALLPEHDLRVLVCDATGVAQHAAHLQECKPTAAEIFGQAIVGVLLAAGLGKERQRVTLQLAGAGPMKGLFTDGSADGSVRGYVREGNVDFPGRGLDLDAVVGPDGYLSVLRELPNGEYYRAAVELEDPRLDRNLEHYYAVSEQVPTTLSIDVQVDEAGTITRAVGVVVQRLPGGDTEALELVRKRLHAGGLAQALDGETGGAKLVLPLVEGLGEIEVLEDLPVRYVCTCSRERALRGVAGAGREEILDMVARDRGAEVHCEFCKTRYHFDARELLALVDELTPEDEQK